MIITSQFRGTTMRTDWIWHGKGCIIPIVLVSVFCVLVARSLLYGSSMSTQEMPGSTITMRGNVIGVLRFNNRATPQQILIFDDGYASRITNPPDRRREVLSYLPASLQEQFQRFRQEVCADQHYVSSSPTSVAYDLGIRCSNTSYMVQQWRLSEKDVPMILQTIDHHVPELSLP